MDLTETTGRTSYHSYPPFKMQLLKWIGNKQRFAHEIASYFPARFGTYYEPFLGSGAVLGTLAPKRAVASDVIGPLVELWRTLAADPEQVKAWYTERWNEMHGGDKVEIYKRIKGSYNACPNPADFLFLTRACYGGVVRFRRDGYISTPCGAHHPIPPESFADRVDIWHARTKGAEFVHSDFEQVMDQAQAGDVVYCDPPYSDTQAILYGAQAFSLERLFRVIRRCKERGVYVLLSIDGSKQSGDKLCNIPIPNGLFEEEALVNCGRSMLRRFQMRGESLEREVVNDRLLLTF
ncbi:MAG TPA: Dam family site-specific DNA-(adenine-N6)-methyltransferase [Longimicrobium sp.]|nr:Dam family site-specific DNA-(adenine-N6)-methyltransferase [Longimicrobium sp.]